MDDAGIYARDLADLDRAVRVGVAGGRVISVAFPRDPGPDPDAGRDHPVPDRIESYFAGEPEEFADVTVALTLPTRFRPVLETLRSIPHGETVTVEALARMTPDLDPEDAGDLDTVREALSENPAPLLIPDHRVTDGTSAAPADVAARMREIEGIAGAG